MDNVFININCNNVYFVFMKTICLAPPTCFNAVTQVLKRQSQISGICLVPLQPNHCTGLMQVGSAELRPTPLCCLFGFGNMHVWLSSGSSWWAVHCCLSTCWTSEGLESCIPVQLRENCISNILWKFLKPQCFLTSHQYKDWTGC